jgi:hypothetical protein
MDNIYIVRGTEQAGPFTESDIRAQLASGALTGDSMVWWDGLPEWTPISRTPLGSPAAVAPAAAAVSAPAPVAPAGDVTATIPATAKISNLAIISLVTGILAIPMMFCYGLGLALGLVAIITGHIARGQLKRNPAEGGTGFALAGVICGYCSVALTVLGIIAICVLIALGNQVKTVFSTIQSQLNAAAMTNNAPASPTP